MRVCITGLGVVSPAGVGVEAFWSANVEGRSGLRMEDRFDLTGVPCGFVNGRLAPDDAKRLAEQPGSEGRVWPETMMRAAVAEAVAHAELPATPSGRGAFVTGLSHASPGSTPAEFEEFTEALKRCAGHGGLDRASALSYFRREGPPPTVAYTASRLHADVAERLGGEVTALSLEATCSTGLRVIAEAALLLRMGKADFAIASASSARTTPYLVGSYSQMSALSRWKEPAREACRPFDRRRDGMVIGEGAAALVLETDEHARARGACPLAEVAGHGFAGGGRHPTQPQQKLIERVMQQALASSGLEPTSIDAVNAHGTSTRLNDLNEAKALHGVFGDHTAALGISACKSILGHSSIASGAVEAVAAVLSLVHGIVPPVATCEQPDPACNLPVRTRAQARSLRAVLKNAFGFGGQYGAMVFLRAKD